MQGSFKLSRFQFILLEIQIIDRHNWTIWDWHFIINQHNRNKGEKIKMQNINLYKFFGGFYFRETKVLGIKIAKMNYEIDLDKK